MTGTAQMVGTLASNLGVRFHAYLEWATQALTDAGKPVNTDLYQHLLPLGWEHINLTGDYV